MRIARVLAAVLLPVPLLVACTSTSLAVHHTTSDSTVTQTVTAVKVVNGVGGVAVHAGTSPNIGIHRAVDYQGDTPPQPGQAIENGTLVLTANCRSCSIAYDLTVPASVGVTINDSVGTVSLDGLSGPIAVNAASGHVRGTNLHSANVDAQASAGAIDLAFSVAPARVMAHSKAGAVSVEVPAGTYAVDARVTVGAIHINVANNPNAANHLTLTADVGAVTVNAAPAP